jgi:hypothetical protein
MSLIFLSPWIFVVFVVEWAWCPCLENREHGRRDPSRWPRGTLYPQKLAITLPRSGGRSVSIVRSRTQAMEFVLLCFVSMMPFLRVPLTLWYVVRDPNLISCDDMVQEFITLSVVAFQKRQSSTNAFLFVLICEYSWNPHGTNFSVSELNYDSLVEDRSRNILETFMGLINIESRVFTNVSMNPLLQIHDDCRRASRSRFILHVCPSPIKQRTPRTHIPLVRDTFPIHFDKLAKDFGRANVFRVQKSNHRTHLIISGISDWHGSV